MGKIKLSLAAISMLAVLIMAGVVTLVWNTGYSISDMDWNSDGETSVAEMWRAIDVSNRPVERNGIVCQEFFSLKDGLPIRVDCPDSAAK